MVTFWDTSALVPLLVGEAKTNELRVLFDEDKGCNVWWGTRTECASALARLEREQALEPLDLRNARRQLIRLSADWTETQPTDALRDTAEQLLKVHPLRASDAFQLAAAMLLRDTGAQPIAFICSDARLRTAAIREGFDVLP